jgi:hypothetical protein
MATRQQQAMQQQQNMQRMQQQMAQQPPVRAASGGLMSAVGRSQPAGMAALIRQHMANPVKAADGGLMAVKRFSEGGQAQSLRSRIANLEAALKRYENSGSDTRSIRQALLHAKSQLAKLDMPREIASLEGRYPAPPPEPVSTTDTGDETARLLNRYPAPPPAAQVPTGPGARNQPPVPTTAQPTAPAPTEPGIPSLTTANVDSWGASLRGDYDQMGKNGPNIEAYREHEARRQASQRALFEAQKEGSFTRLLQATARGATGGPAGGLNALLAMQAEQENQRMAAPQFEHQLTEQDIAAIQQRREAERGYKEGAVKQRGEISRPLGQEEMQQQGATTRDRESGARAVTAAEVAHRRAQELARLNSSLRTQEALANPRGVGGVGGYDKEQLDYLKLMQRTLQDQLKADKGLQIINPTEHARLKRELAAVERALAQALNLPIQSTDAAPDGVDLSKWGDPKMR